MVLMMIKSTWIRNASYHIKLYSLLNEAHYKNLESILVTLTGTIQLEEAFIGLMGQDRASKVNRPE